MDAMIVFDRGASVSGRAFANAKTSLKSFISSLHLSPDQAGVVSFASAATLVQPLTTNGPQAKNAIDGITASGASYIGSGIAAAQAELSSGRHNPSATPIIIVVSDGADQGAPNASVTLAAANAAKSAGIRIISLQYGSGSGTLMQSIASSNNDFYVVPNP
jgi:Mg-chelatase subunit ChlD